MSEFKPQDPKGAQPLKIVGVGQPPKLVEASIPQKDGDRLPEFIETVLPPKLSAPIANVENQSSHLPPVSEEQVPASFRSTKVSMTSSPVQVIGEAEIPRRAGGEPRPVPDSSGIPLPPKLPPRGPAPAFRHRDAGSIDDMDLPRPAPRFDPEPKPSLAFAPSYNTAVKMRESKAPLKGFVSIAPPSISFSPPAIGEPLQRQVKIVWPKPTGQKPAAAAKGAGEASCQLRAPQQQVATFPGQQVPVGGNVQQVPLKPASEAKQVVSIRHSQDDAVPLPPPPSQMRPAPAPAPAPSMEDPKVNVSIERIVFLQRVEKLMANEARIHELENEAGVLRSTISVLGGEVARLKVELEIAKAKKG